MENLVPLTQEWIGHIKSPTIQIPSKRLIAANVFNLDVTENPANSQAVGNYSEDAKKAETPGTAPVSLYDGMQTTVNMCRVKADYDPLDINNKGNKQHFIAFTNQIAGVPFITLDWASVTEVKQESHNADMLIDSFVNAFQGILEKDKQSIISSVKELVKAALSYAGQVEKKSNFAQNLLQTHSGHSVTFGLYSSEFEISVSEHKGSITYHSSYLLAQAQYSLAKSVWDTVQPLFADQQKTTINDWLKIMKTPAKQNSSVRVICLE